VRVEPQEYCRVNYQVDVEGRTIELDVRACRPADVASLLAGEDGPGTPGPLGRDPVLIEDQAVVVDVFPRDRKLPVLRTLEDRAQREDLLRSLLPEQPELWKGELRALRYRAGRRFVAQLVAPGGARALLKAGTSKGHTRSKRNATAFRSKGALRVARLLGADDEHHLLAFEWLPGAALFDLISSPQLDGDAVAASAAALADLHAQSPTGLPRWKREAERDDLQSVAAEIGYLCPWFARQAGELAARLAARLADAPEMSAPLHGDFSARHVLVDEGKAAIIDLDWACRGDPADDLGGILAQVERHAVCGGLPHARAASFREALLLSYRKATRRPLPERIGLYRAVELFRGARFPFRKYEPEWPRQIRSLLLHTEGVLGRSETR
jgi:streptomycin 6-kinase